MVSGFATPSRRLPHEDVLAHLPISTKLEYPKGHSIYDGECPSTCLYLITEGKVKLSQIAEDGSEVVLGIMGPDEVFGQSAFLAVPPRNEKTSALEKTTLMMWPIATVEDLVTRRPRLAVALLQIMAGRTAEFARRIESFSKDNVERRLARTLLSFSERLGTPQPDGMIRMMPFTHGTLARYVGTSREVITQYMNQFRQRGYLSYSRQGIALHPHGLAKLLAAGSLSASPETDESLQATSAWM